MLGQEDHIDQLLSQPLAVEGKSDQPHPSDLEGSTWVRELGCVGSTIGDGPRIGARGVGDQVEARAIEGNGDETNITSSSPAVKTSLG